MKDVDDARIVYGGKTRPRGPDMRIQESVVRYHLSAVHCPSCRKAIVSLEEPNGESVVIRPIAAHRNVPNEVPPEIAQDYQEAAAVLNLSPKANAALSRRCLQAVLREAGKTTQKDLAKQIDEVLPRLPRLIADAVDYIRNVGNFAAHPIKSKSTGEIVDVEPGEAEWNLEVLDLLFDHYYVQPARAKQAREALNKKLKDAGKPPMK